MSSGDPWSLPVKQGLYDPTLEKDACGVGFIVAIDGKRSHKVNSIQTIYSACMYSHDFFLDIQSHFLSSC